MRIHNLKCEKQYIEDILSGDKTFELRYNDRAFQKGDILELHEPNFTKVKVKLLVTYVLSGKPWLADNFVVLGIKLLKEG